MIEKEFKFLDVKNIKELEPLTNYDSRLFEPIFSNLFSVIYSKNIKESCQYLNTLTNSYTLGKNYIELNLNGNFDFRDTAIITINEIFSFFKKCDYKIYIYIHDKRDIICDIIEINPIKLIDIEFSQHWDTTKYGALSDLKIRLEINDWIK